MRIFIRTEKDLESKKLFVENAFRGQDGKYYLLLHRLPPEYAKGPVFLVELSNDRVEVRAESGDAPVYYKAYAFQALTDKELTFLSRIKPGKSVLPFLNFSYPNVIRILGKQFECLSEAEATRVAGCCTWKLVGGLRE